MTGSLEVHLVDVFTPRPFAGNPAAVVRDAGGLSGEQMRRIAGELSLPATAFVREGGVLGLRWFAPGAELMLCGHGTLAAVHVLRETGRLGGGRVTFETAGGPLPVAVEADHAWLEPPLRAWTAYREPLEPILDALGAGGDAIGGWAPVARSSDGDLLIPARGLDALKGLVPDLGRLAALGRERGIRGFALTCRETVEPDAAIHSRFFAPHLGIPEDATTGSLHAALPIWLWDAGALRAEGDVLRFRAEQGDFVGRPGRLAVELHLAGGRPARVRVGGQAVTVLTGRLRVP